MNTVIEMKAFSEGFKCSFEGGVAQVVPFLDILLVRAGLKASLCAESPKPPLYAALLLENEGLTVQLSDTRAVLVMREVQITKLTEENFQLTGQVQGLLDDLAAQSAIVDRLKADRGEALAQATPEEKTPRKYARKPKTSDIPVPDITVPDITVPDITVPDITVPDITVPDITVPDITVPDITVFDISPITQDKKREVTAAINSLKIIAKGDDKAFLGLGREVLREAMGIEAGQETGPLTLSMLNMGQADRAVHLVQSLKAADDGKGVSGG